MLEKIGKYLKKLNMPVVFSSYIVQPLSGGLVWCSMNMLIVSGGDSAINTWCHTRAMQHCYLPITDYNTRVILSYLLCCLKLAWSCKLPSLVRNGVGIGKETRDSKRRNLGE